MSTSSVENENVPNQDQEAFDEWSVVKGFLDMRPLTALVVSEAEAFYEEHLPDILCGGTRSEVFQQHNSVEHRFWFENMTLKPPMYQNAQGQLVLDSFDAAFKRKATLCCVVCADVLHATKVYRECLTLEQLYAQCRFHHLEAGWCAVKARVKDDGIGLCGCNTPCPEHRLPLAHACNGKWAGKAVVLIVKISSDGCGRGRMLWSDDLVLGDVFEQTSKKPFPEYDERVLVDKTLVVNRGTTLFETPLLMGVFRDVPQFCSTNDCASPLTGSFVVNGLPKQIFTQVRLIPNEPFVFKATGDKHRFVVETRSLRDTTRWNSTSTLYIRLAAEGYNITVNVPNFVAKNNNLLDVSLHHCLILLGVTTRDHFEQYVHRPSSRQYSYHQRVA